MTRQDILELIEEAAKNKTDKLDLSYRQLTALPPEAPEKKKSMQDIIANPVTIASFIIALAVIYLTLPTNIALILIIIVILIFVFLVALNPKKG
jgi:hypothetical protein